MSRPDPAQVSVVISELIALDHLLQAALSKHLPKGMEMSHYQVLSLLRSTGEKSPAQLARAFNLTKGAMTNTLRKLGAAGHVHIRPDWDDARKKLVAISPAGEAARQSAEDALRPLVARLEDELGQDSLRQTLPVLRRLRQIMREV